MVELGLFGTQKFAPRRRVEKQIAHFDSRTARMRRRFDRYRHFATFAACTPATACVVAAIRRDRQPRYRTDTRQRFAAKPQAAHAFQIFERENLAGCVAAQRQRQIIALDTAAVIADADQIHTAGINVDVDHARTGVDAVFKQLFDHRRRAFDDLASGDLVRQARA